MAMTLDECERQFVAVRNSASIAEACHALEPLFEEYKVISLGFERGSIYWRARIAREEPWPALADVRYPPSKSVKVGRVNDDQDPHLYASMLEGTALLEVSPRAGDYVQVVGFRVRPGSLLRLAVIGELHHVSKTGFLRLTGNDPDRALSRHLNDLPHDRAQCMLFIDAFLGSLLGDPSAGATDYRLSRAVASMLRRDQGLEGIAFPSVRDLHGMNVALASSACDTKLHPVTCFHARFNRIREFGFVDFEILRQAKNLSADGGFVWQLPHFNQRRQMFGLTKAEFDAAQKDSNNPNALVNLIAGRRDGR